MKKITLILTIFLALCLTVGAVSASDDWSFSFSSEESSDSNTNGGQVDYKDGELKIQGLDFKIPDGYKENSSAKKVGADAGKNFDGFKLSSAGFDKGNDFIDVKVIFGDEKMDKDSYTPPEGSQSKKIGGHDGYITQNDNGVTFDYIDDGKVVEIVAPSESVVSSIIE